MLSERKKLLALLSKRQQLEQEHEQTHRSSIQSELDNMVPALVNFFKCTDPADLAKKYPTTADMQAAADKQRYFASRKINVNPRAAQVYERLRKNGTDTDYLEFVRMTKTAFISIVSSVLKQNPLYKSQSNGQEIIEKQMAVTLWRMGHHGKDAGIGDASKIFGLSEGSIMKCTQRCMEALNGIAVDVVRWPSRGEKRTIKNRIKELAKPPSTTSVSDSSDYSNAAVPDDEPIEDAIGVLTSMKIVLHSRPIMTNPDEYLVPVPPRLLHAAAEWFAASGKKHWASIPIAESSLLAGHDWTDQDFDQPSTTSTTTTVTSTPAATTKPKKRRKTTTKGASKKKAVAKDKVREIDHDTETGNGNHKSRKGQKSMSRKDAQQDSSTLSSTSSSENSTPSTSTSTSATTATTSTTSISTATMCPSETTVDNDATEAISATTGTETPTGTAATDKPTDISVIKSGGYVRRDYGYNVLMVCDSTTRIRLVEKMTPASWTDQQSLESSTIHNNSDTYFDEGEYLVSDGTLALCDTILPVTPILPAPAYPTSTTPALTADEDFETRIKQEDVDADMHDFEDADTEEIEAQKRLYEGLARIHKRARDCERMLKARFPSLLGVRVQIKDDQVGHDNVKSWIMACATIHNLVLADDTSFDPEWETQLDHWEEQFHLHQEHQARFLWKANHKPQRRPARRYDPNNAVSGSEDPLSGDMNDAEAEDNSSDHAGCSLSNSEISTMSPQPSSGPPVPTGSIHHSSLPPLLYGDELAREFNSRLAEKESFRQNQALGEADITETLNRLSESIKASTQAKVGTRTLHQEHHQQLQDYMEYQQQPQQYQQQQEASGHTHPSTMR